MKRLTFRICLFCLLLVVLPLAASCGKGSSGGTTAGTTPGTTTGGTEPTANTFLIGDTYAIVSGTQGNASANGADLLRSSLSGVLGTTPDFKTDRSEEAAHEIIVGTASRPASEAAEALLREAKETADTGVYVILAVGDQLVLTGDTRISVDMAVERLIADYIAGKNEVRIPTELRIVSTYSISAYETELKRQEEEQKAAELAARINAVKDALAALPSSEFGTVPTVSATKYPAPTTLPSKDVHPRVMVNAEMLDTLRKNLTAEENKTAYKGYMESSDKQVSGILPTVTTESKKFHNYDQSVLTVIEAKAYRYLLTGEEIYGYEAILAIQNFIRTLDIWKAEDRYTSGYMTDIYRPFGYTMYIAAEVYDWCHDLMTADDCQRIVAGVGTRIAPNLEVGFPPSGQGAVTGHGSEAQLLRDWLSFSIAVYDEYPLFYNFVMGRIQAEYVPLRNYYFQSEMQSQGNSYGSYRFQFDLLSAYLFRTMSGKELYSADLGAVGRSLIFNLRPDLTLLRIGDDTNQRRQPYSMNSYGYCMFYLASIYDDPVAKGEAKRTLNNFHQFSNTDQSLTYVQFLVMNHPEKEVAGLDRLPTAKYFGSPVGQIIARSAWNDPNAVLLYMKVGEYFAANHEHKDCGSFQIYYRAILASDSGFYDAYGTVVDTSYTKSTLAHNSLLIYDPKESTGSQINVGGQKSDASESNTLSVWLGRSYTHRADVLGYEIGTDQDGSLLYTYLAGDLTNAYTAGKVDEVLRSMYGAFTGASETPLVFFVFDKITADSPDYKKTFLLHSETEPTVSGNRVTICNGGGKLVNQTLLPGASALNITVVEGSYTINGQNYEITRNDDTLASAENGWGRVEISPATGNRTDYLLNVMVVADEDGTAVIPDAVLYETDLVAGASLLGQAAFFPKSAERLSHRFTVCGAGEGAISYAVAGVNAGKWIVYAEDGSVITSATATEDGGLLTFTASAGTLILAPEGTDPSNIPGDGFFPDPYPMP